MSLNRRNFLKNLGLTGAGLALSPSLLRANQASNYRAIVCVFLYGGMDQHDTLLPYDTASYQSFSNIRRSLIQRYGGSRERNKLLPINSGSGFEGRQFALPQELSGIHQLYGEGKAAVVGNVGPLVERTTAASFESSRLPPRLFSHNDQQALWMSNSPEGSRFGWGGLLADHPVRNLSNASPEFTAINGGGSDLFLTGNQVSPYRISGSEASKIWFIDDAVEEGNQPDLVNHFRGSNFVGQNLLRKDIASMMTRAHDANLRYNQSMKAAPNMTTTFPNSSLGSQLQGVARSISIRQNLGLQRQVFMVGMGGFDTHDAQATALPKLHSTLDQALVAFQKAMAEMGLENQVTLFTASDFGRTLVPNGDGTDHGWAGHSIVLGGSVKGGQVYGDVPPSSLNHSLDAGNGRIIPTTSVEEFAAPMARWFGLSDQKIQEALPGLGSFSPKMEFI